MSDASICLCVQQLRPADLTIPLASDSKVAQEVAKNRLSNGLVALILAPVILAAALWFLNNDGPAIVYWIGFCGAPIMLVVGVWTIFSSMRVKPDAFTTFEEWLFDKHGDLLQKSQDITALPEVLDRIIASTPQDWAQHVNAVAHLRETQGQSALRHYRYGPSDMKLQDESGLEVCRFTRAIKSRKQDNDSDSIYRGDTHVGSITFWAVRSPNSPWRLVLHNERCLPWAISTTSLNLPSYASVTSAFRAAPEFWHDVEYLSQSQSVLLFTCKSISDQCLRFDVEIAPWLGPILAKHGIVAYVGEAGSARTPTYLGTALKERGINTVGALLLENGVVSWSIDIDWTRRSGKEIFQSLSTLLSKSEDISLTPASAEGTESS